MINFWMQPNMMLQKFPAVTFSVKTKLALHSTHMGDQAGLIIFGLIMPISPSKNLIKSQQNQGNRM